MEPNEYDLFILGLFKKADFLPGMEIVEAVAKRFTVSDAYARKILQRATEKGVINSSKPLTFGKGQYLYIKSTLEITISSLKEICKKYRPPLFRLLEALEVSDGIISYYEALKISSSPLEKGTSKTSSVDELLLILLELKLVITMEDDKGIRYIIDNKTLEILHQEVMASHYSKMVIDASFIPDIIKWLRNINIIDNIKTIYRNKKTPSKGAAHNNLVWDAFAYSKTTGINPILGKRAYTTEKQTLVVLDVVIHREYEQFDIDGFLSRIQINLNSVKTGVRKIMPIVFYSEISDKALNILHSLGFMSFNIGSIFGTKIHEIIKDLATVHKNIFIDLSGEPEIKIRKSLRAIRNTGQEENLSNLKGTLFEYLIYPVLKSLYPDALISQNKTLSIKKDDGSKEKYEYDYIIQSTSPKELIVIELKGYSSESKIPIGDTSKKNTLNWFFGKTLPFAKSQYSKELSEGYRLKASYITSGGYFEDGIQFLQKQDKYKSKKLSTHYDGPALLALLEENEFTNIKSTVERYYIKSDEPEIQ